MRRSIASVIALILTALCIPGCSAQETKPTQSMLKERFTLQLEEFAQAPRVEITARDRSLSQDLTNEQRQELTKFLQDVHPVTLDNPLGGKWYPDIILQAYSGDRQYTVDLFNPKYVLHEGLLYAIPSQMWTTVLGWLPPENSDPTTIQSLFKANSMDLQADIGDPGRPWQYKETIRGSDDSRLVRMHHVVRLLLSGTQMQDKEPQTERRGALLFAVGGTTTEVIVGRDWFSFQGKTYAVPDLIQTLRSILMAG